MAEINGQRLPSPKSLYPLLLEGLTGKRAAAAQAAVELDAYFASRQCAKRPCCVVTPASVCFRMLPYADVCGRLLTNADV